ncbi:ABC transporter substrate-binding protein [Paenibacillus sanguinis]|uniref:ABC transporter substrate-binding protein n=1 Tax=Paenibacillus sanguinis TaxID=225906 RepID=UPI00037E4EE9|nr:ABC transporter substrate-binding protein [Paenibacillus sanguinis]
MNIEEHIRMWQQSAFRMLDIRHVASGGHEQPKIFRMPANAFIAILQGEARLRMDEQEHRVGPFHIIHACKGMSISLAPLEAALEYQLMLYKPVYTLADPKGIQRLLERRNPLQQPYITVVDHPVLIHQWLEQIREAWADGSPLHKIRVQALFLQLVHELLGQLHVQGKNDEPGIDLTSQALRYIHERYAEPITIESMAADLHCSTRHLSRVFRQSGIGLTPSDYLMHVRMNEAGKLLRRTKLNLQDIAAGVGYSDSYSFSRMFKKYSGFSPLAYRNQHSILATCPKMPSSGSEYPIVDEQPHDYIDNNNQYHLGGKSNMNHYMVTRYKVMMLLVSTFLLLSACSAPTNSVNNAAPSPVVKEAAGPEDTLATSEARTITHDLGETRIEGIPQRIITLEQGFTQVLASLEIKPVGVADDNKPERFPQDTLAYIEGYTSVGTRSEPNLEIIRTLKPDLIIADTGRHAEVYGQLSEIAPTIAYKNDGGNYEQAILATQAIGDALDKSEEAAALLASHKEKVEALAQAINLDQSVLIVAPQEDDGNTFQVRTDSSFHGSFLKSVGLNYALSNEKEHNELMTIEQLLTMDPDVLLILINEDDESILPAQASNPLWNQLRAVQNGRAHEVELATWSRQRSIPALDKVIAEAPDHF